MRELLDNVVLLIREFLAQTFLIWGMHLWPDGPDKKALAEALEKWANEPPRE